MSRLLLCGFVFFTLALGTSSRAEAANSISQEQANIWCAMWDLKPIERATSGWKPLVVAMCRNPNNANARTQASTALEERIRGASWDSLMSAKQAESFLPRAQADKLCDLKNSYNVKSFTSPERHLKLYSEAGSLYAHQALYCRERRDPFAHRLLAGHFQHTRPPSSFVSQGALAKECGPTTRKYTSNDIRLVASALKGSFTTNLQRQFTERRLEEVAYSFCYASQLPAVRERGRAFLYEELSSSLKKNTISYPIDLMARFAIFNTTNDHCGDASVCRQKQEITIDSMLIKSLFLGYKALGGAKRRLLPMADQVSGLDMNHSAVAVAQYMLSKASAKDVRAELKREGLSKVDERFALFAYELAKNWANSFREDTEMRKLIENWRSDYRKGAPLINQARTLVGKANCMAKGAGIWQTFLGGVTTKDQLSARLQTPTAYYINEARMKCLSETADAAQPQQAGTLRGSRNSGTASRRRSNPSASSDNYSDTLHLSWLQYNLIGEAQANPFLSVSNTLNEGGSHLIRSDLFALREIRFMGPDPIKSANAKKITYKRHSFIARVAYNCKTTNRIDRIHRDGRVDYVSNCKYKKMKKTVQRTATTPGFIGNCKLGGSVWASDKAVLASGKGKTLTCLAGAKLNVKNGTSLLPDKPFF